MDAVQERIENDAPFRDRLFAWLRANGVEPNHIPNGERPSFVDGQLTLRMFTLNANGRQQIDPRDKTLCLTHEVTVPVVVQPDADVATWLA